MAKGLKFIPKPSKSSKENVDKALSKFSRRVKLTEFFKSLKIGSDSNHSKFREKSQWTPSDKLIDDYTLQKLSELIVDVNKIDLKQYGQNMSKADYCYYRALKLLKQRKDIVIKPADKGSSTIILNKSDYIFEAYRQLSDSNYYKKKCSHLPQSGG